MSFRKVSHLQVMDEILLSYSFPEQLFHGAPESTARLREAAARRQLRGEWS